MNAVKEYSNRIDVKPVAFFNWRCQFNTKYTSVDFFIATLLFRQFRSDIAYLQTNNWPITLLKSLRPIIV